MASGTKTAASNGTADVEATRAIVHIPQLHVQHIVVRVEGKTPLITHRFSERAQRLIEEKQQGAAKVKPPPRNPEQEMREACYRTEDDPDGYYFPASGVKRAMVTAGQRFSDEKGTELLGSLIIPTEMLRIIGPEPRMRADRVNLGGMSRQSSIAYRPEFSPWEMDIPIIFNSGFISTDQVVNLLRLAGFAVGIGDWRVEKKGSFGTFEIKTVIGA